MDKELEELLVKSRNVTMTSEEIEQHRLELAVANGSFSDSRITVETMKAGMTVVEASEKKDAND